ncbi:MAG: MFS transporter, partial [Polyangiales bacterium]
MTATTSSAPAAAAVHTTPVLPLRTQLAFSAQAFFDAAMDLVVLVFLGKFYVDVALLPAGLLALAIAAARAFDAVIDPVMGYVTDHTRSRFGRRKPWICAGMLGSAVVFYRLLSPPAGLAQGPLVSWFLACFAGHFFCTTLVRVPKGALAAELSFDPQERVRFFGLVAVLTALGLLAGTLGPTLLQRGVGIADPRRQMSVLAALCSLGSVLSHLWLLWGVRERRDFQERGRTPLVPAVRHVLRNRPFMVMLLSTVVTAIPAAIPATLMPFFVQYVLRASTELTALLILTYLLSGFLALPFWMRMAARRGKLRVWLINGFIGVTGGALMFLPGPGDTALMFALEIYVGLQSQVFLVLASAMQADTIDYDELRSGKRREGQFGALSAIVPKFTLIPGAAIPLAILGGAGYVPNAAEQSPGVVLALRVLFALVPAAFNLLGLLIMRRYPLSEARHAEIRAAAAQHARGEAAIDPITGQHLPPPNQRPLDEATGFLLDHFSLRELRAYTRGKGPLQSVLASVTGSAVLTVVAMLLAVHSVTRLDADPGPMPSLAIVTAGAGFT